MLLLVADCCCLLLLAGAGRCHCSACVALFASALRLYVIGLRMLDLLRACLLLLSECMRAYKHAALCHTDPYAIHMGSDGFQVSPAGGGDSARQGTVDKHLAGGRWECSRIRSMDRWSHGTPTPHRLFLRAHPVPQKLGEGFGAPRKTRP